MAVQDFTDAYHTDETLCDVEVLIEHERDGAITWQCSGEWVEERGKC